MEGTKHIVMSNQDHAGELLEFLKDCREKKLFCDITINIGSKSYKTHRLVLAMVSDYLKVLMQRDSKDDGSIQLNSDDIPGTIFEQILEYAYTGKLDLNDEDIDVFKLAEVSDFLGAVTIKNLCEDNLLKKLTTTNVIQFLIFSEFYNLQNLYMKSKTILESYFESLSKQREFFDISPALLKDFLNNDNLRVCQGENPSLQSEEREKCILKSMLNYVNENIIRYPEKSSELFEIFHFVKLPIFDKKPLQKFVLCFKHIKKNEEMQKLIYKAVLFQSDDKTNDVPKFWMSARKLHHIYEVVQNLAVGGQLGHQDYRKFDSDEELLDPFDKLQSVTIWIRRWDGRKVIGAISTVSANSGNKHFGEQDLTRLESSHTFALEEGEVITKVSSKSGFAVDSLKFVTSHGNTYGPYGGDGGGMRNSNPSNKQCFLHSFVGASVRSQGMAAIIELGFRWVRYI